mmetsp:Transcript_22841/g.32724  ORF Transcript_22841/g.32724 Transcript_22841/m.32724 type:complete len:161 (-) Transcript_22841:909-1391(-)
MAVKEMINSEGCNLSGGIAPSNYVPQIKDQHLLDDQTDDRSVVSQHSAASRRSCYERYAVPDDGNTSAARLRKKIIRKQQERSTNDDDESVCTTGSRRKGARHNAAANNDDESVCASTPLKVEAACKLCSNVNLVIFGRGLPTLFMANSMLNTLMVCINF